MTFHLRRALPRILACQQKFFCKRSLFGGSGTFENPPTHFSIVVPGKVSPQIRWDEIPKEVSLPPYAKSASPLPSTETPEIKDAETIEKMRESCRLARKVLDSAGELVRVGLTTDVIDKHVHQMSIAHGAYPSPLNYRGFPKSVCTSINNVICHGIPDDRPLESGDILNIDITVYLDGVHGDCSETYLVGDVDDKAQQLIEITKECLAIGLDQCSPGKPFAGIGEAIENHASNNGFSVVPMFIGHGIGSYFHGPPDIYHAKNGYPGCMEAGMTFTVEPIISEGNGAEIFLWDDGWTALTSDYSRSAQFEHTILITQDGIEILTEKK